MVKLLGIPYDTNSSFLRGPALAPPRIRLMEKEGSANCFSETGIEIANGTSYDDLGDISFPDINHESAFRLIKHSVSEILSTGEKLLCLGGDHSITFPIID